MKALKSTASPTIQAYGELQAAFEHYNAALFDGQLPHCLITMQREKRTYGYFSSRRFANRHEKTMTDEIAMNPSYFGVVPLLEILQTLVHEMAHAWQFHFGEPGRRGYHNKEWADKMEAIGLMPSDTGKPGGKKTGEKMADYAIDGGPFMQATEALLKTDFRITWFDRHPPAGTEIAAIFGDADDGDDNDGGLIQPAPAGNKSNRDKYRCPCCGAQAWGKPAQKGAAHTHHVSILTMNGDSYRLKQSAGRRSARRAEQNQATVSADPNTGEIPSP